MDWVSSAPHIDPQTPYWIYDLEKAWGNHIFENLLLRWKTAIKIGLNTLCLIPNEHILQYVFEVFLVPLTALALSTSDWIAGMCPEDQNLQNASFLPVFPMEKILTQCFHTTMTNIKCCSQTFFKYFLKKKWTSITTIWNQISPAAKVFTKKANLSIFSCPKP